MPNVRGGRPEDAPELVRLAAIMYESMGMEVASPEWLRNAEAFAKEGMARGDVTFFVADDGGGRLVACGGARIWRRLPSPRNPSGLSAYIQWMVTEPQFRRRGLARKIFAELLASLRVLGVRQVDLHATQYGESLYRAFGFHDPRYPELRANL